MEPAVPRSPLETVLKGNRSCGCGRKHRCALKSFLVADSGCETLLPGICRKLKAENLHFVSDYESMETLGNRVMQYMGGIGYTVSSSVLPEGEVPVCDHEVAGSLLLRIPAACEAVIAVGDKVICDLVKFVCLKDGLPCVLIPVSASTDSYALASADFLENGIMKTVPASSPFAILADLEILAGAPMEKTNAGIASVIADYISVADWKLSSLATGSFVCDEICDSLLEYVGGAVSALRKGISVHSPETAEAVITGLVASGAYALLAGSTAPIRGSESAMAEYLQHKLLGEDITDISFDALRGVCALYALRMYEAVLKNEPDFEGALTLFDGYGWSFFNREMYRVFGEEYASRLLSRFTGDNFYDPDSHWSRVLRIKERYYTDLRPMLSFLPSYSSILPVIRSVSFPTGLADLDFSKGEAVDALVWSKEVSPRYGILRLLADVGMLEYAAERLTSNLK